MRVVRRSALRWLLPLPDGMHFTPAMTARAVLSDDVAMVEVAMPYAERAMVASMDAKASPVEPGLVGTAVTVSVTFEMTR